MWAYNKANASRTQKPYLDNITFIEHKGDCYRNSISGTAGAEEKQAVEAARRLLLDDDGNYRGNDEAVFLYEVCADNDPRGM